MTGVLARFVTVSYRWPPYANGPAGRRPLALGRALHESRPFAQRVEGALPPAARADEARVALRPVDLRYVQPVLPQLLPTTAAVKALYVNAWAFSSPKLWQLVRLADQTEVNAFVVDVKDDTGCLLYPSDVPVAQAIGANRCARTRGRPGADRHAARARHLPDRQNRRRQGPAARRAEALVVRAPRRMASSGGTGSGVRGSMPTTIPCGSTPLTWRVRRWAWGSSKCSSTTSASPTSRASASRPRFSRLGATERRSGRPCAVTSSSSSRWWRR